MDRLDLWLLTVLHINEADKFRVAMSISEILEIDNDTTRISVYKHLKLLLKNGCVAEGPKDNKAHCFYITEKGKKCLLEDKSIKEDTDIC